MSAAARLAAFAAGLIAIVAAGFAFGALTEADPIGDEQAGREAVHEEGVHGAMGKDPVRGLGVAENGVQLKVVDPELARGVPEQLRFQVVDENGRAITGFDRSHTKRMHVIVVRRDLTGFQHLHPEMTADGTWSAPLRLGEPGTYRVFAEFSRDGEATTLADDLRVDGDAQLRALPAPATSAVSEPGGYEVRIDGRRGHTMVHAGEETSLRFEIGREDEAVALQPYLGAGGHLVVLREGDLGFLHVHPSGDAGGDGSIEFAATFPTAGLYRLFLQFKSAGELQTVAFTEEVH